MHLAGQPACGRSRAGHREQTLAARRVQRKPGPLGASRHKHSNGRAKSPGGARLPGQPRTRRGGSGTALWRPLLWRMGTAGTLLCPHRNSESSFAMGFEADQSILVCPGILLSRTLPLSPPLPLEMGRKRIRTWHATVYL